MPFQEVRQYMGCKINYIDANAFFRQVFGHLKIMWEA